jgi:uncharacterized protein
MGDISNEPSMEDILSSIKRIIAEEGESAVTSRARRPARAAPAPVDEDEILELSEPVPAESPSPAAAEASISDAPAEPILSATTAQATRGPLEALSRMIVKPDIAGSDTLEGVVREMLRPMLREWLDANLPRMVEEMVQREIARITAGRD